MSTTAKARTTAAIERIEADLRVLTHPDDLAGYIAELRSLLSRHAAAAKRDGYDKHTNAATGS